ncbi:PolC-type DNA polymerase III [Chloracidobacterium thermophilum]|uniref:3'-5' exonuclease n=1 Tax=Chloracidobacterium thermophilum TaxID=458033 RepID=UPI0007387512|nr:exonuclease domain-containing protein [Chloracidobacterium thermophilum]
MPDVLPGPSFLLRTLRARLSAARGVVSLTELGRELLRAPRAAPELVRRVLLPVLAQLPEAVLEGDDGLRWQPLPTAAPEATASLLECQFAVVDVETTGRRAEQERIIEVACVTIERGRITETFASLVNPGVPIPPLITALTGISDELVATAPPFAAIAAELQQRLSQTVFVAHHASFDRKCLTAELRRADETFVWTAPTLCTVQLARQLVPGLDNYRLDTVTAHFRISNPARHRASGDALATAQLFLRLLERLIEQDIVAVEAVTALLAKQKRTSRRRRPLPGEDRHHE